MKEHPPKTENKSNVVEFPKSNLIEENNENLLHEILFDKGKLSLKEKIENLLNTITKESNKKLALNNLKIIYEKAYYIYRKSYYFEDEENNLDVANFYSLEEKVLEKISEYTDEGNILKDLENKVIFKRIIPEFLKDNENKEIIKNAIKSVIDQNKNIDNERSILIIFLEDTFWFDKNVGVKDKNRKFLELMEVYEIEILLLEILNEYIQKDVLSFSEKTFGKIKDIFYLKNKFKSDLVKDLIVEKMIFQIIIEADKVFNSLQNNFSDTELKKLTNLFFHTYPFHLPKDDYGENIYKIKQYFEKSKNVKQSFSEKMTNLITQNRNQSEEVLLDTIGKVYKICDICGYEFFEIIQKGNGQIIEVKNRLYKFKNEKLLSFLAKQKKLSEILEMEELEDRTSPNVINLDNFRKK